MTLIADCSDCGGWGCKPPSDTCPTCGGVGLTKWKATLTDTGERHVVPIGDLRSHDENSECWCRPFDDEGVTVHNSMDRREQRENGNARDH